MARRHIRSDFAPDVFVFPGGKADPRDIVAEERLDRPDQPNAGELSPGIGWPLIWLAAIRELFEEAGLLLARAAGSDGSPAGHGIEAGKLSAARDRVRRGEISMRDLAEQHDLIYEADRLLLFSNWVTPPILNKRFDTFFFLVRLRPGEEPVHADLHELTDSLWTRPEEALERYRAGSFPLVFATERHLQRLAAFPSVDELWTSTRAMPVRTVMPRWREQDGARTFLIPGDPGYVEGSGIIVDPVPG